MALPLALFFASGGAALIYETVWVRELGRVFGNTSMSVALVTGLFVAGLGLGSFLAGRLKIFRRIIDFRGLWRAYAACELAIAIGAAAALFAQSGWLQTLPSHTASYEMGRDGLFLLSRGSILSQLVLIAALILPSTLCMGATLPLMFRLTTLHGPRSTGWKFGLLYALNTAGGMMGCMLVDFVLIPSLGSRATQGAAISLNLLMGLVAWLVSLRPAPCLPAENVADAFDPAGPSRSPDRRRFFYGTCVVAISGFTAMGLQVVWARFLTTALGGTRGVFSLLLAVILAGMWLGSLAGGWAVKRWRTPLALCAAASVLMIGSAMAGFLWFDRTLIVTGAFTGLHNFLAPLHLGWLAEVAFILRAVIPVVGITSFWAGFTFPAAVEVSSADHGDAAQPTSVAYMVNCLGAWLGALVTGFCLLPEFGMQIAILLLSCATLVIPLSLAYSGQARSPRARVAGKCATLCLLGLTVFWLALPSQHLLLKMFDPPRRLEGYLSLSEDLVETIAVDEHPVTKDRFLLTNGHAMSGTSLGSLRYMRMFSHLPLLQLRDPRDSLVICFGVGNTLHAASLYPSLQHLDVVDTSRHVLRHAPFFSEWNHNALKDPRVRVFINDGRHHLQMKSPASYDLITLEPPPIGHAGVASLYTREFYQLAYSRLRAGGFLTQWLPALQVPESVLRSAVRAFVDVFPNAVLLHGHADNFILMGRAGQSNPFDLPLVRSNLAKLPQVRAHLDEVYLGTMTELMGSFVASAERLDISSQAFEPLVDDKPSMEYGYVSFLETRLPLDLIGPTEIGDWCKPPEIELRSPGDLVDLPAYLAIMDNYYRTMPAVSFLQTRPPHRLTIDLTQPATASAIQHSGYLQGVLHPQLQQPKPR
ncbi:MAG: hypothetical protein HYR88_05745 [Verrucomicrobia bacterium]|nr:hypothetical protein [Verrucomicrobiota bacterium]